MEALIRLLDRSQDFWIKPGPARNIRTWTQQDFICYSYFKGVFPSMLFTVHG